MQVRRITVNGREFVLVDPDSAAKMLEDIEAAARSGAAWVTIPVRETNPPKVFVTPQVVTFLDILEVPDEDPEVEGAAHAFALDWPETAD